jgi:hypothetical protein
MKCMDVKEAEDKERLCGLQGMCRMWIAAERTIWRWKHVREIWKAKWP